MQWEKETRRGIVISHHCRVGDLRVSIHRHIDYEPEDWLMSVYPEVLSVGGPLECKDSESAKAEALSLVRAWLKKTLAVLEKKNESRRKNPH